MSSNSGTAAATATATPAPATVSLPLSFANSFWSTDYRTGFSTIYDHLHSATIQSTEIINTIKQRAQAERDMSTALMPPALRTDGFALDEGASLRIGFEAMLTAQVGESRARLQLADNLLRSIVHPFESWSHSHSGRIASSRSLVEGHLSAYEKQHAQVLKLKQQYDEACRLADQAEDELNFSRAREATPNGGAAATMEGEKNRPQSPLLPTPTTTTISAPPLPPKPSSSPTPSADSDARSEDGLSPVNDDDDTVIPRSGLVGGGAGITSALGRALTTVRRKAPHVGGGGGAPSASGGAEEGVKQGLGVNEEAVGKAVDWGKNTFSSLLNRVAGPQTGEERHERARKHAEEVEGKYKQAVLMLDGIRLILEQTLSEHLSYTQRCESDRLKAAASVLRSYHAAIAALPRLISEMGERVEKTLEVVRGEKDVRGVVERKRTGPFQPRPIIFHSHYSEPFIQSFGIDLRRWAETSTSSPSSSPAVPPILTFLLTHLSNRYPSVSDAEKRKSWLYETPLAAQHHLRGLLNGRVEGWREEEVEGYDLPVVASVLKLWLLELEVPPIVFTQYDEFRQLYPKRVGQEQEQVPLKVVAEYVSRLPPVHLEVLRTLITHFSTLISSTSTPESDDVYLQKLGLSLARCIMRPKVETAITLDDRFPALLVVDLIRGREVVFKSADELKVGRDDRYKPRRQRTKPIDVRISRSRMGLEASEAIDRESADAALLEQQQEHVAPTSPPTTGGGAGQQYSSLPRLSLPVSADEDIEGGLAEPQQQQQQQQFAASPLDMHAPTDLPPPIPVMPSVPEPTAPPADTVDEDDVPLARASPTSPDAPSVGSGGGGGGSITRSTRLRGARGPRPPSVGGAAGQPAQGNVARIRDSFTRSSVGLDESEGEK